MVKSKRVDFVATLQLQNLSVCVTQYVLLSMCYINILDIIS